MKYDSRRSTDQCKYNLQNIVEEQYTQYIVVGNALLKYIIY